MELDYKAIGKRVKIARIKADLKQEQLAERTSLSPTHISNVETRFSLNGISRNSWRTVIPMKSAWSRTWLKC